MEYNHDQHPIINQHPSIASMASLTGIHLTVVEEWEAFVQSKFYSRDAD